MKCTLAQYIWVAVLLFAGKTSLCAADIYVSPQGNDSSPGTKAQPVATLSKAQLLERAAPRTAPIHVYLLPGKFNLTTPLILTQADSGTETAPVTFEAVSKQNTIVSSGLPLTAPHWTPYKNGIMQTAVPANWTTDQLFVDGQMQIMARYPNYDPKIANFNGFAADAISPERVARWADPAGGFIHALHSAHWGGFSYLILGKKPDGTLNYEGGWQNNRPAGMDKKTLFVENIFEELDSPGEWYLNDKTHTLYFYPPVSIVISHTSIEGVSLPNLIEFRGTDKEPVKYITFKGVTFTQTNRTFMETKEPLLRTDWAIYRGGAILFNGSANCGIQNCTLTQLGGNAIFVNDYNRAVTIKSCHIYKVGAGGVNFVGAIESVRNPLLNYGKRQNLADISQEMGPQTDNYPKDCRVEDCLIHDTGTIEKQSAPVNIDISESITVSHCSIYHCPRAGINIGDGCFGGHIIEFCDIFDTVRETGDHGSFNSWGRDRWWGLGGVNLDTDVATKYPKLPILDCYKPITLTNSRWRCDKGWDIDLDDGSSNYVITNNLCLRGGIKNREGFFRMVENNIMVNCGYCPHVWYADSSDVFEHNILTGYNPAGMKIHPWGNVMDYNLVEEPGQAAPAPAKKLQAASGRDEHSIEADPLFVDPAQGNYQVQANSPALALGFKNFPMDQFGVQSPELRALALTPTLPPYGKAVPVAPERDQTPLAWNGATLRNVKDEGEMSVYGLPGVVGIVVTNLDPGSKLATAGLRVDDVILGVNQEPVTSLEDLKKLGPISNPAKLQISRAQSLIKTISLD